MPHAVDRTAGMTLSTSFSGICAPSVALSAWCSSIPHMPELTNARLNASSVTYDYQYNIECDPECTIELRCLPHKARCGFTDINSFLSASALSEIESLGPSPSWEELKHIVFRKGIVTPVGYCSVCNLSHTLSTSDVHVGGHLWSIVGFPGFPPLPPLH